MKGGTAPGPHRPANKARLRHLARNAPPLLGLMNLAAGDEDDKDDEDDDDVDAAFPRSPLSRIRPRFSAGLTPSASRDTDKRAFPRRSTRMFY